MTDTLNVSAREELGTSATKKLRRRGFIPANIYGHGKENVNISIPTDQWEAVVRQGSRVVTLDGAVKDTALISEVQWDTYAMNTLHVDLIRVSADERVETAVTVELKGEAPGAKLGGIVNQLLHEVEISCRAMAIPDSIVVSILELGVGDQISAADLELPDGAELVTPAEETVVACVEVTEEPEEEAAVAMPGEPEVIGADDEDEGSSD